MADYRLGSVQFATSPERDRLAALRSGYLVVGLEHREKFLSVFPTFKTADALFTEFPKILEDILSKTVHMAARDIASDGVYDLADAAIRSDLEPDPKLS